MKIESEIIEQLKNNIEGLIPVKGLKFHFELPPSSDQLWHPDFIAHASFKNLQFKIVGEVVSRKSFPIFQDKLSHLKSYAGEKKDLVPIIVAQYLSPDRRKQCQNAGVYFLDLSGNVFLEYEDLYIERIGFPNRFPEERRGRGPFSDKASLMLRAMFSNKVKLWGVRELAQSVNLNPGFVSRMARELEKRNYVVRLNAKLKLRDPKSILEDWVREYDYKKNREVKFFCLGKSPDEIMDKVRDVHISEAVQYAFGLHAGAHLASPYAVYNEVHIYIPNRASIEFFEKRLKLKEAQQGANVIFLLPYYKQSVFYGKQKIRDLWVVSDIQLYLDLYNYPIRGLEQAEHLYEKRLKKLIEG
jgi:hypothetical protein